MDDRYKKRARCCGHSSRPYGVHKMRYLRLSLRLIDSGVSCRINHYVRPNSTQSRLDRFWKGQIEIRPPDRNNQDIL
jgi:hypothetical protein